MEIDTSNVDAGAESAGGEAEGAGSGEATGGGAGALTQEHVEKLLNGFDSFGSELQAIREAQSQTQGAGGQEATGEQEAGAQEGGEGGEYTPIDLSELGDDYFDAEGGLTLDGLSKLVTTKAKEVAQEMVNQAVAPIQHERNEERISEGLDRLLETYPDLAGDEIADQVIEGAKQRAQQLARDTGNKELANAWREPSMLEMVYLAQQAQKHSEDESSQGGGQRTVQLERGGSASPTGSNGADDAADRIVNAGPKKFRLSTGR